MNSGSIWPPVSFMRIIPAYSRKDISRYKLTE